MSSTDAASGQSGLFEARIPTTHQTAVQGQRIQIVGEDIFVTNPEFIARGIKEKAANAVLIKLKQHRPTSPPDKGDGLVARMPSQAGRKRAALPWAPNAGFDS